MAIGQHHECKGGVYRTLAVREPILQTMQLGERVVAFQRRAVLA
jgi:hypothetical protein